MARWSGIEFRDRLGASEESRHMSGDAQFVEDIPTLAAAASELAVRFCAGCQNYHFLWPYLRLIGSPGSASEGRSFFETMLGGSAGTSRQRVLIAGAADSGLLSLVARATHGHQTDLVVLDRCNTPLELCRRFSAVWSLGAETVQLNLDDLSFDEIFDAIIVHSTLELVSPDSRQAVLTRLRRALRPDGRLILRFRTRDFVERNQLLRYIETVPSHLIDYLKRSKISLPEPIDTFRRRIEAYAVERHEREALGPTRAEIEQLLDAAGFRVQSITPIQSHHSPAFGPASTSIPPRRFVALASP